MKSYRGIWFLIGLALTLSSCASLGFDPGYLNPWQSAPTRVDTFPKGEQTNILIGGLMGGLKDVNVVERVYPTPYAKVWATVKQVAEHFDKVGGRPLVAIDEKNGRIQNGRISENSLIGIGSTAWTDEFLMEVTAVSPTQTRVAIARKVVEKEIVTRAGSRKTVEGRWKSQWSNSQIENWLHTQIEQNVMIRTQQ